MLKKTKTKIILFSMLGINALHYYLGGFVNFCHDPESFCVVTFGQRVYMIAGILFMPIKLIMYPFDWFSYKIVSIDIISFFFSLLLYWIFITIMMVLWKKSKFLFFVVLSILASITIGINFV